jgi:hypothetical protein
VAWRALCAFLCLTLTKLSPSTSAGSLDQVELGVSLSLARRLGQSAAAAATAAGMHAASQGRIYSMIRGC